MAVQQDALAQLAEGFGGPLLRPDDAGYEEARSIYNGMIETRPALIARCFGTADVVAAVRYAREQGMPIAVRCGGHGVVGYALGNEDALVVDLSPMRGVHVDPQAQTARAQGGALTGDLDRETQLFGLAAPTGRVTTTGMGGFTLGGGYAWASPKLGLACDALVSAEVVTAEGKLVTASEDENPDLFWALRGGGGNFGAVTSFEFRLQPLGPMIYAGLLAYGLPQGEDVMNAYTELAVNAPDELGTCAAMVTAPDAPFVPPEAHGHPVIAVIYAYFGDHAEGERLTQGLRAVGPVVDLVQPMPYRGFQTLVDALNPPGNRNYWRGELLSGLTDGVVDTFLRFPTEGLHPLSALLLFQHGGAVSRVPDDATAISGRDATFMLHPIGAWEDPAEDEKHIAWVRGVSSAMEPFKTGGVYLNFMADEDQARAGFGDAKYARLAAVKREYDPENVFRFNQNIQPA